MYFVQQVKDFKVGPDDEKQVLPIHGWINKTIWLISTARNIIVVVFCAVMAYLFDAHNSNPFILTGNLYKYPKSSVGGRHDDLK